MMRLSGRFGRLLWADKTGARYALSSKYPNPYLPVGAVFPTVAATTVSDGRGVGDTHSSDYSGSLWTDAERTLLGFGSFKEVLDATGNYRQTIYSQTPECSSQPLKSYLKAVPPHLV